MLITFLDKSQIFDGSALKQRPLGASEKSLILLAEALANIGHIVRIFNNCEKSVVINKVSWNPISNFNATHSDIWISLNDPKLFDLCEGSNKKILWLINSGLLLSKPEYFQATINHNPTIVYQGKNHIDTIPDGLKSLDAKMITLGVSNKYSNTNEFMPSVAPKAFVNTNPLIDLDWLINLWINNIHTKLPWAELYIFSMTMYKGLKGNKIGEKYETILAKVKNNLKYNIHVKKPKIDSEFIEEIKSMRVHLYPSHNFETSALTLMESQALGIPAVTRQLGAAHEKIINGKTGFVAQNDIDFSEYTIRLMNDIEYFKRISNQAKELNLNINWDTKVKEFITLFEIGLST